MIQLRADVPGGTRLIRSDQAKLSGGSVDGGSRLGASIMGVMAARRGGGD